MMFGLYETLFLYVVSGTISRCSRRFLDRSGLLRGWSGTVKGCSGNFSRLFWDHSGPFSGCCGTIQDVPGPFQVVPESFQAVLGLVWDQCGVLLDLYWCFLAVPGQLRAVPRRSSVSKTPWWGIWKDAFRFWFNIFFIQVPYWFLGLFFLVFFSFVPGFIENRFGHSDGFSGLWSFAHWFGLNELGGFGSWCDFRYLSGFDQWVVSHV